MRRSYNILLYIILLPMVMIAHNNNDKFKGKYTKEKKINKEFNVNPNAGLRVNNSFGNIDIVSWNENKTVIDVIIRTNGDNEEAVKERLDQISINFSGNGSLVTAKTIVEKESSSAWSGITNFFSGGNKNNVSMEINYLIKIPVTNSVDLKNDFGTININRLEGNAKIDCEHGQLILGDLLAENNYLSFDFTNKSTIRYMKSGKIRAEHSSFTLEKAESLELNADHTTSEINDVKELNYNCDYGKLIVGNTRNVIGRGDHISSKLGTVDGSLNVNIDFGSIYVNRITNNTKEVIIRSEFTGISIGFEASHSFDFIVDLEHASLKGIENVSITKANKDYTDKYYEGYYGSKNSGNNVNISSQYGGVKFIKL